MVAISVRVLFHFLPHGCRFTHEAHFTQARYTITTVMLLLSFDQLHGSENVKGHTKLLEDQRELEFLMTYIPYFKCKDEGHERVE